MSQRLIERRPGDANVSGHEDVAIARIDATINDIKQAAIDDGWTSRTILRSMQALITRVAFIACLKNAGVLAAEAGSMIARARF